MIQNLYRRAILDRLKEVSKLKISTISALGTFIVLYSSLIPFSNTILEAFYSEARTLNIPAAKNNLSAVVWSIGICLQPTILILAKNMKPYESSYSFPLFTSLYSASFYFLPLLGYMPNEDFWFFFWLILIVFFIMGSIKGIKTYLRVQSLKEKTILRSLRNINRNNF